MLLSWSTGLWFQSCELGNGARRTKKGLLGPWERMKLSKKAVRLDLLRTLSSTHPREVKKRGVYTDTVTACVTRGTRFPALQEETWQGGWNGACCWEIVAWFLWSLEVNEPCSISLDAIVMPNVATSHLEHPLTWCQQTAWKIMQHLVKTVITSPWIKNKDPVKHGTETGVS